MSELLPIHGFVLAGGKSSRMGEDKAMLDVGGKPMVQIAVEKLKTFCAEVSISGNRDDLARFAPVVHESRLDCGPGAGVAAGLQASLQPWVMFIPVDVPFLPAEFLEMWAKEALRAKMSVSYLGVLSLGKQPGFCLLQRERFDSLSRLLDGGERKLERLLNLTADADHVASWMYDEWELYTWAGKEVPDDSMLACWFSNLNTPEEFTSASKT